MTKSQKFNTLRAGAAPLVLGFALLSAPAFAQEEPQEAAAESGEIVVTGSLISNPNLERSAPVNVTTSDEIELLQSNVAEEILREIPGIVPSIGSAVNNGNGGASFVNLRGLGSNRNIVIIDGVRLVPAELNGRFDLNNIPVALVERVEVLTGGASTTYGADAISGVVNFITKQDFAGAELQVSNSITEEGDGNQFRVDATIGANFDDGRGNAVFSIGYQETDAVFQGARTVSTFNIDSFTGGAGGSGTSVPSRFSGVNPTAVDNGGGIRQITTDGLGFRPTAAFDSFNFNPFNIFQTPFERFNIYGAARYEISDDIEVYTRGLFSKNTVETIIAPSGSFGISTQVNLSNPFLTTAQRNAFCAFDTNPAVGVFTPRFTQAECDAAALATDPDDPNYREVTTALFRRSVEAGPRIQQFTTTIFDYRLGFKGGITDSIEWDVFGTYGESENVNTQQGFTLNSRVRQSLLAVRDAAGNPVCIDPSNGCVPADFFGLQGDISPEAVSFLVAESQVLTQTTLAQARATISGDFGTTSPWASEPIAFAVGGEYRSYTASQVSDLLSQSGDLGGAGGAAPNIDGGFDVYEAIGEIIIPIVSDRPFFEDLTISGGIRYSDYTVDAPGSPSYSTTTYKGEAVWEIGGGFKVRGGYSRAVRAPNVAELFAPVNTGLTNLADDPCATLDDAGMSLGRPAPSGELLAVCLAQGATPLNVNAIQQPIAGQANATSGGNLDIQPETSDSFTIGAVWQPDFIPGFSISVDYYNISVEDAITTPTPGDAIAACFGTPTNGNFTPAAGASSDPACTSIGRDPLTGGLNGDPATTSGLLLALSNGGSLETDGIDLTLNYRRDIGFADLSLAFNGNYTFNSRFNAFVANPESVNRECTGFFSINCGSIQPEFQWTQRTTLSFEDIDVSLLWRHIDEVVQEPLDVDLGSGPAFAGTLPATIPGVGGRTVDFGRIEAYDYFDLSLRFQLTDEVSITALVENLFDRAPPLVGSTVGTTAFNSGNTYPSTYDALGRTFSVSARLKF